MIRQQEKTEKIVEVAIKRFSHFGVHKSTLAEIAEDAGLSRQALLYYFSDKQAIVNASIEAIGEAYLAEFSDKLSHVQTFQSVLLSLVDARYEFLRRYHMIISELYGFEFSADSPLIQSRNRILHGESEILQKRFNEAIASGEVREANGSEVIEMIQTVLHAFIGLANRNNRFPALEDISSLIEDQKKIILLLYHGISCSNAKEKLNNSIINNEE